jgi:carbon starvation protein CstA
MLTFIFSIALLILGYLVYGRIVEKVFGVDPKRVTPAFTQNDGVDYVPLPWWKIFLIQFLNIAGLGPIFGAILGAAYGPIAFLWIVLGCIFAGAVHDFFSGMLSIRNDGVSIPEVVGKYLGIGFKQFMRAFTVLLMILVGVVFVVGPAGIMASITPESLSKGFWVYAVLIYYILATLLPIDKLIGRIYPLFGAALLFMALGIGVALVVGDYNLVDLTPSTFFNMKANSSNFPAFPLLFVTIACGAISGFHSTQSPLMARCLKNESLGRRVFYGAMVAEGIVALIWAAAAMAFFGGVPQLNTALAEHQNDAAWVVKLISDTTLGKVGGILALLGVVAAPITSGDTAFRSARLIVADFLRFKQVKVLNRLMVSLPIFLIGYILTQLDFAIIWRYMAWSNQTLATIVLWAITVYLSVEKKFFWITLVPAIFMTAVITNYILIAPEGFQFSQSIGYPIGIGIAALSGLFFWRYIISRKRNLEY